MNLISREIIPTNTSTLILEMKFIKNLLLFVGLIIPTNSTGVSHVMSHQSCEQKNWRYLCL